jgi:ribonuclease BN (tRNA processing enzyme)
MKIRILGCHGSDEVAAGRESRQRRTCGFLLNDTVMMDAGTVGTALTLSEQQRLRHILLSHLHFDHIQGLPTLADNLAETIERPVTIASIAEVLDGLKAHIFNGAVYPDFMKLPTPQQPVFACRPIEVGRTTEMDDLFVTPIRVNHLVPAVGFLIRQGGSSFLYSGDTYQTEEIWKVAAREPTLKAALIETSFPDEMGELAFISKHLTPALFAREFKKIGRPDLPVYVYHIKPRYREAVERQLAALKMKNLRLLQEGEEITV